MSKEFDEDLKKVNDYANKTLEIDKKIMFIGWICLGLELVSSILSVFSTYSYFYIFTVLFFILAIAYFVSSIIKGIYFHKEVNKKFDNLKEKYKEVK